MCECCGEARHDVLQSRMSIPGNRTLVIKGVSMVKKEAIIDALSRQGLLLDRNNPKFDDDRYGQNLICYANYKSTTDCNEAEHKMQRWLNERKWDTSDVHVYVKSNRFQCKIVCVCKDKFRESEVVSDNLAAQKFQEAGRV
jgi:hypothetical protein